MKYCEEAVAFACEGEDLLGILTRPEQPAGIGVVVVVGGPQTRVGSHRQFVLLARAFAAAGYTTLRFDNRGMGDSTGEQRDFEAVSPDIGAAIDALHAACPAVTKVVLWGLCDAAAAALLYCHDTPDQSIAGLCLLNPWVRSEATLAKTQVKHYYGQRLLQKQFWQKLLSGRLNVARAVLELLRKLGQASSRVGSGPHLAFQERMAQGMRHFPGRMLLLLSENDYTAKEFLEYTANSEAWRGVLDRTCLTRVNIENADHTFASKAWRGAAEKTCIDWLRQAMGPEHDTL